MIGNYCPELQNGLFLSPNLAKNSILMVLVDVDFHQIVGYHYFDYHQPSRWSSPVKGYFRAGECYPLLGPPRVKLTGSCVGVGAVGWFFKVPTWSEQTAGFSAKWNKIAERTRLVGAQDYVLPLPSQGALGGQSIKYLNLFDALAAL